MKVSCLALIVATLGAAQLAQAGTLVNTESVAGSGNNGASTVGGNTTPSTSACGDTATRISEIQGNGDTSPLNGQPATVEAVVTASFNQSGGLGGFFVESLPADDDGNPATSEGLFIYDTHDSVQIGDRVRVTGKVSEYKGLTELGSIKALQVCAQGLTVAPVDISLPWADAGMPERYESMLVRFNAPLTVSDNYDLERYGSVLVSNGRLFSPTQVADPGADANAVAADNALNQLILDDGSNAQDPDPIVYPAPQLTADNTLRDGARVSNLTGILEYSYGAWRLQPTTTPNFVQDNPRPLTPSLSDDGNLRVASFNVLNYFNGDGQGGGFPTPRGADNANELARQQAKIVSAIQGLHADVVGLMELENDGYGQYSAIATLTRALGGDWTYINPGLSQLGGDAIAVGMIYRADKVTPVGPAVTVSTGAFADLNRQPLAQTFRLNDGGEKLTVIVNHLKSKGCGDAAGADAAQGDGQGCWNPTRTAAASQLVQWLSTNPTGTGVKDQLIVGDLNSYNHEDPLKTLSVSGFTDLSSALHGDAAYSYVYYGQMGSLDHALANPSLRREVVDVTEWHINADEPKALDYNMEYKSAAQQVSLYDPDPYRASDHDPVLVELKLRNPLDFNGDGRVDGRDMNRFVRYFVRHLGRKDSSVYDLDGDGRITFGDLFALVDAVRQQRHG